MDVLRLLIFGLAVAYYLNGTGGVTTFDLLCVLEVLGLVADPTTIVVYEHGLDSITAFMGVTIITVIAPCNVLDSKDLGANAMPTGGVSIPFGNASLVVEVNTL